MTKPEALRHVKALVGKGSTLWMTRRGRSKSGMRTYIDVYVIKGDYLRKITTMAGTVCGYRVAGHGSHVGEIQVNMCGTSPAVEVLCALASELDLEAFVDLKVREF